VTSSGQARLHLGLGDDAEANAASVVQPGARLRLKQVTAASAFPAVHASYSLENVAITVWYGSATMESLAVFERGCKPFCARYPQGVSTIHIMVPGGTAMPSSDARAELARIVRENAQHAAAAAVLIPSNGFWASALRGMVTAMQLLAPRSMSLQIFAELEPLANWLAPLHTLRTGVALEPSELLQVLKELQPGGTRAA
jgi:hypothetical protein